MSGRHHVSLRYKSPSTSLGECHSVPNVNGRLKTSAETRYACRKIFKSNEFLSANRYRSTYHPRPSPRVRFAAAHDATETDVGESTRGGQEFRLNRPSVETGQRRTDFGFWSRCGCRGCCGFRSLERRGFFPRLRRSMMLGNCDHGSGTVLPERSRRRIHHACAGGCRWVHRDALRLMSSDLGWSHFAITGWAAEQRCPGLEGEIRLSWVRRLRERFRIPCNVRHKLASNPQMKLRRYSISLIFNNPGQRRMFIHLPMSPTGVSQGCSLSEGNRHLAEIQVDGHWFALHWWQIRVFRESLL